MIDKNLRQHFRIAKNSPVPLYYQLKSAILELFENGYYKPGDKLPTEAEFCELLDISRPTIRQAFAELIHEGYITRQKAKGTFVSVPKVKGNFFMKLSSYDEEMKSLGLVPSTKVLQKETLPTPEGCQSLWESETSLYLKRLRYADEKEMVVVETYVPSTVFPDIAQHDFEASSLYQIMEERYQCKIAYVDRVVEARLADEEIQSLLHMEQPAVILYVKTKAYTADDRCVEYSTAYYHGERNTFKMRLIQQG